MVVACCDSRVPLEAVFDCTPGEIFVLRSIANLIPPYAPDTAMHGTSAALEYAVRELEVSHLVILGHSLCGGIQALMRGPGKERTDFIEPWMSIAEEARRHVLENAGDTTDLESLCRVCEQESIRVSLRNLTTFPWIKSRLDEGALKVGGFYFDAESGDLKPIDLG